MNKLIYDVTGYQTNALYRSAKKIQDIYRDYRDYQINKRIDIIKGLVPYKEDDQVISEKEEDIYWKELRYYIKNKKDIINNWCII